MVVVDANVALNDDAAVDIGVIGDVVDDVDTKDGSPSDCALRFRHSIGFGANGMKGEHLLQLGAPLSAPMFGGSSAGR